MVRHFHVRHFQYCTLDRGEAYTYFATFLYVAIGNYRFSGFVSPVVTASVSFRFHLLIMEKNNK